MTLYGAENTKVFELACHALIPAAGAGTRLGGTNSGEAPKQYLALAGKPMLWHAVRALCVAPVESVFVVLAPGDEQFGRIEWGVLGERIEPLYCGGESRRDSVYNGMVAAMAAVEADDWMLVHDAARPCVPPQDVQRLISETGSDRIGGVLALPVADTVKRVGKDEGGLQRISGTEDRSQLWLAQTPQMFRCGLLLQALKGAKSAVTDEASAVEQMGLRPRLVLGSRENIKVTYPEDLSIAEAILSRR
ncbi:MAG TPA: 2-C-methyl-D-erythritol 4-phosphate cytidylyltransferase [Burkholderiales bacterium]|jgi:2-C-methyl-D-erythritol 4-phosphate cytidylyltransferase|nr:2-C-methyl-D-erythritol 4-phosphate cytidylyltransferase [Burkholderiales bacterium]